jgi:hypothetical protein
MRAPRRDELPRNLDDAAESRTARVLAITCVIVVLFAVVYAFAQR